MGKLGKAHRMRSKKASEFTTIDFEVGYVAVWKGRRLAIVEGLKGEAGISALPPEICHLGEEVLGETVGCGSPLCWGPRHQELWP